MDQAPDASIIVCTRNRARSLELTLRSVLEDSSSVARECIAVDNGSTDETVAVISRVAQVAPFEIIHVLEHQRGLSHARNRGVSVARGRFLLFTDDDVIVHPGWADALVAGFSDPTVGAVGGRIVPVLPPHVPPWMAGPQLGQVALEDYGPVPRPLRSADWTLPLGANFAVRRDVLIGNEPFDTSLGHTGNLSIGWEEWHTFEQIEARHRIAYIPDAVGEHHFDSSRLEWASVRRTYFQNGYGLSRHRRLRGGPTPDPTWVGRLLCAARDYKSARRLRRRNAALACPTAADAYAEFEAYRHAGAAVESALHNFPRASEWVGTRLA